MSETPETVTETEAPAPVEAETPTDETTEQGERTFTQADVERIVTERLKRDRDKSKVEAKTLAERLEALETELATTKTAAARSAVQARFGLSDADAELFLTGTDADTLERQAKALADRLNTGAKASTRPAPAVREGNNPAPSGSDDMKDFLRRLTATN